MGHRSITLAVLALAALPPAAASAQMPGGPPPPFESYCPKSAGPVTTESLEFRLPGADWVPADQYDCVFLDDGSGTDPLGDPVVAVSFSVPALYSKPDGTQARVTLTSNGPRPLTVAGSFTGLSAVFSARKVVVTGAGATLRTGTVPGPGGSLTVTPDCSGTPMNMDNSFAGIVDFDSGAGGAIAATDRAYAGSFFASNAFSFTRPLIEPDGESVSFDVQGCGDGDPSTEDGFFQGFIPATAVAELGIPRPVLADVSNTVIDELIDVEDNGRPVSDEDLEILLGKPRPATARPAATTPATKTPEGISIDYKLSFSKHRVTTRANARGVKLAKKCRSSRGKLKVVKRGKGKKATRVLTCVKRK
jgi:hypothetical protein